MRLNAIKIACVLTLAAVTTCVAATKPVFPPKNPFMVDGVSGMVHLDPSQQDSTPAPGPTGIHVVKPGQITKVSGGLINLTYVDAPRYPTGEQVIWMANNNRIAKVLTDNGQFKQIAEIQIEGQPYMPGWKADEVMRTMDGFTDESALLEYLNTEFPRYLETVVVRGAVYTVMDYEGTYFTPIKNTIYAFGDKEPGNAYSEIEIRGKYVMPEAMLSTSGEIPDAVFGMNITHDGRIVVVTMQGVVAILERDFSSAPIFLKLEEGEMVTNGIAADNKGGIYIVSNKYMRKLVWNGEKLSSDERDGAWKTAYDIATAEHGGVSFGGGSGSTPSLMGFGDEEDKLVVITDGMNVMNVVAFWRDEIPEDFSQKPGTKSRRIAGQIAVTFGKKNAKLLQSEQSVAVYGYGAFVVNNTLPEPLPSMLENAVVSGKMRQGPTGAEKLVWNTQDNKWERGWTAPDVSSPSIVPMISGGSNQVYVNGFVDGHWEVTGMHWDTGEVVTRLILPSSHSFNGAYSILQILPDGDMTVGGMLGRYRINVR